MAASTLVQKVKVKEEAKECCGYKETTTAVTATATTASPSSVVASTSTSTAANASSQPDDASIPQQPSSIGSHPSPAVSSSSSSTSTVHVNADPFPVDLELKTKAKASSRATGQENSREDAQPEIDGSPRRRSNGARASTDTDPPSPLPAHTLNPDEDEANGALDDERRSGVNCGIEEENLASPLSSNLTGNRCIGSVFAGHGELKSVLGTVVKFATGISPDTGDTVLTLVLALLSGNMTAEEFHSALQEATNYSLKGFVLPHLKQQLPSLQRDLSNAARASNQSCTQYLRSNEAAILEAVGLVAAADQLEVFGEHTGNNGNQCPAHYGLRSNSNPVVSPVQHANNPSNGALHHYSSGGSLAPKRRASDTPYYENGAAILDDVPVYGKRLTNPWNHHHLTQQPQPQPPTENSSPYCWYHPLHSSSGSIQGHGHRHGHGHGPSPNPIPSNPVQITHNQMNPFSNSHHLNHHHHHHHHHQQQHHQQQQQQQQQQQLGHIQAQSGSLDDEWKNIHMMLNCILGMVEKTKKALAILQSRGCFGGAAVATGLTATNAMPTQNGTVSGTGNNPSAGNSSQQVESSTGDREGSLKRLSGEIVAQTIRAIEDKVAEVKRKDEEAVKRAVMAEVQRAVRVAVAESRSNERLRVHHRLVDVPLSQRTHGTLRQGPYLRVPRGSNTGQVDSSARTVATPTTVSNSIPSTSEDEKDAQLQAVATGSSCWNCGRPALETCGGCGIARYCGSFCQHRDWEAGGHHATCNNPAPRERPRSASRSPPRTATEPNLVTAAPIPASVASKAK